MAERTSRHLNEDYQHDMQGNNARARPDYAPTSVQVVADEREKRGMAFPVAQALKAPRLQISNISPAVDQGRRPAKGVVNQPVTIRATIFGDGHNRLAARVVWKHQAANDWFSERLQLLGNDHWEAVFTPEQEGKYHFRIEAWLDRWQNYHHELYEKYNAGVPIELELQEGCLLLQEILDHYRDTQTETPERTSEQKEFQQVLSRDEMPPETAEALVENTLNAVAELRDACNLEQQVNLMLDQRLAAAVEVIEPKQFLTQTPGFYLIDVERTRAGFASWYELFPRSCTPSADRHGTFDDVIPRLRDIQNMGFDVLYFPPVHPIGERNRKGKNNTVDAQEGDVGSPYAIGSEEGGHDAVYSKLGGIEAFRRLRDAAQHHGMELAMDFAIQCAPDHPWLNEHPDWFSWRPDGSIRYAENPPKKYQDIVNVDFYRAGAKPDMWVKWRDIIKYWISEGVHIFRVDNPHTKPLPFWEWLIADIRQENPEVIFLSEAFTRPAMMQQLAKIGFTQSYTYFIWRNSKQEMIDYLTELSTPPVSDFFRPNFFVNTPDINPYFTQQSGRAGFLIRSALAATLSGLWGVYSGFELCEAEALPGKEEYLNSEKYEIRPRNYDAAGNIKTEIAKLNFIRKAHPAMQTHLGVRFYYADNDQVLFFGKSGGVGRSTLLVAISLDPHHGQNARLHLPVEEFDFHGEPRFVVHELMRDLRFTWEGREQHWYFNPDEIPFAIWKIDPLRS